MITVRFFAAVREIMGRDSLQFHLPATSLTASEILSAVAGERLNDLPKPLLVAINYQHAEPTQTICDGDEVAFFPPVSGG